jgi:cytoskeletal protein CcmA (bactofilin family)
MFNNNEKQPSPRPTTVTDERSSNGTKETDFSSMNVISERSEIIGTLKSRRNIRIAGKIDGGVEAEGKVVVASTGLVEGSINAKEAHIAGSVKGDVHVSSNLTLASSAVVESDLYVQSLSVEEGATFNGTCHMEEQPEEQHEFFSNNGSNNGYSTEEFNEEEELETADALKEDD